MKNFLIRAPKEDHLNVAAQLPVSDESMLLMCALFFELISRGSAQADKKASADAARKHQSNKAKGLHKDGAKLQASQAAQSAAAAQSAPAAGAPPAAPAPPSAAPAPAKKREAKRQSAKDFADLYLNAENQKSRKLWLVYDPDHGTRGGMKCKVSSAYSAEFLLISLISQIFTIFTLAIWSLFSGLLSQEGTMVRSVLHQH
jgi:hypothetical protein